MSVSHHAKTRFDARHGTRHGFLANFCSLECRTSSRHVFFFFIYLYNNESDRMKCIQSFTVEGMFNLCLIKGTRTRRSKEMLYWIFDSRN